VLKHRLKHMGSFHPSGLSVYPGFTPPPSEGSSGSSRPLVIQTPQRGRSDPLPTGSHLVPWHLISGHPKCKNLGSTSGTGNRFGLTGSPVSPETGSIHLQPCQHIAHFIARGVNQVLDIQDFITELKTQEQAPR